MHEKYYQYLNKLFKIDPRFNKYDLSSFNENRSTYLQSLVGTPDEEYDYDEEYEEEDYPEPNEFGEYDEEEDLIDKPLVEDNLYENGILYQTAGFDLEMLYTLETSVLNSQFSGLFSAVITELFNDTSKEFYRFFGAEVESSFKKWFTFYKKTETAIANAEDSSEDENE